MVMIVLYVYAVVGIPAADLDIVGVDRLCRRSSVVGFFGRESLRMDDVCKVSADVLTQHECHFWRFGEIGENGGNFATSSNLKAKPHRRIQKIHRPWRPPPHYELWPAPPRPLPTFSLMLFHRGRRQ